jgi:hypothetical protein
MPRTAMVVRKAIDRLVAASAIDDDERIAEGREFEDSQKLLLRVYHAQRTANSSPSRDMSISPVRATTIESGETSSVGPRSVPRPAWYVEAVQPTS